MRVCHNCGKVLGDADRFCPQCGTTVREEESSESTRDAIVGRTVGGAYTVLELVGVGGMGKVYRAEQTMLGRTVAIKVVHPHLLADETSVARFYSEARTASRLNHPNSVGIIDFGRTEDGVLYLVMEFLRGKDLARVMHEEGPLPFGRIVDVLTGALAALGEAHSLSVVHRDLKPENIVLEKQRGGGEIVKVVDFGLAKLTGQPASSSITSPGLVCGTPDYMSPEQGRGEEVDGRGDIYSVGIVLWELLTDRLPFVDDTPAKVVLRHMTDPVPDPREVAPHRSIPGSLAEVAMKAMAKRATDRYQTADDMAAALRRAAGSFRTLAEEATCATCGSRNPIATRFCGSCGARLAGVATTPPVVSRPPTAGISSSKPPVTDRAVIGRDAEIAALDTARGEAHHVAVHAHVSGEAGVGKTRLLAHLAAIATEAGDLVAFVGPHPSGAPVPYHAVRELVQKLLGVEADKLESLGTKDSGVFLSPLERAGLAEIVKPTGLVGLDGRARTEAVADAIGTALRVAEAGARSDRVVVIVDDWLALDGPSRSAITLVPQLVADVSLLLVTASFRPLPANESEGVRQIMLAGLDADASRAVLAGGRSNTPTVAFGSGARDTRTYLPLYLEQLKALGYGIDGEDPGRPRRLADAVSQRLEKLSLAARRVLQAAAVLGERCSLGALVQLVDGKDREGLELLRKEKLVTVEADMLVFSHPFVRDVVESSIPAEARKKLHEKALAVEANAPAEVRAEHAYRAGELMSALLLLERMGDDALARGDSSAGVLAFRRGLELVRREALETGDDGLDRAIATFSRKLGEAMEKSGEHASADGVVREVLDLVARDGVERARLLLVLGRVAARRQRPREAIRMLGEALDLATQKADARVAADAQTALARVRREEGDTIGAANALRRAVELASEAKWPMSRQAAVLVELGEVLIEVGDADDAAGKLERAARAAIDADAPAVAAMALGALASMDELAGRAAQAATRYRDAALLAAKAGDGDARRRWERASQERKRTEAPDAKSQKG